MSIDLTELEKRIIVLELEIKSFRNYFDTKIEYIIDYFKKVDILYTRQNEEIVLIQERCGNRFSNCIEKLGDNKILSLEWKNKSLFQILNSFLTFILGVASGLIITFFANKFGR